MGPDAANLLPLPNLEWNLVPQDQVRHLGAGSGMQLVAGA